MDLTRFQDQAYLNLETYRKTGAPVRTPVWFVSAGSNLYVRTLAHSGKVKRLRRDPNVAVAPCDVAGNVLAGWQTGQARFATEAEQAQVAQLLAQKYGHQVLEFDQRRRLEGFTYTVIAITLAGPAD